MDFIKCFKKCVDLESIDCPDNYCAVADRTSDPNLWFEYDSKVRQIRDLLVIDQKAGSLTPIDLDHLRKHIAISHLVYRNPYQPYWIVASILLEAVTKDSNILLFLTDNCMDWSKSISILKNLIPKLPLGNHELIEELGL